MARGVLYVVFVVPVVLSIIFASSVLGQVLQEPDRELNMMQFEISDRPIISSKAIGILGLESSYTTSTPVEIQVSVTDEKFDCGDLYVTIYDAASKTVVTQAGYFGQCFGSENIILPIDDDFSEIVDETGNYEIKVEMYDKQQQNIISTVGKFSVK